MSKIEWTDKTWNPITGCSKCSPGCQNCYAERMSKRLAGRYGYPADEPFKVTLHEHKLDEPLHWKKPSRVFVCSMGDLFHIEVRWEYFCKVFDVIDRSPQHTFIVLTKRPERMKDFVDGWCRGLRMPPNVHLGVTVCNQAEADAKIPILLQTPAAGRFVSVEPMLGAIQLRQHCTYNCASYAEGVCPGGKHCLSLNGLDWVICGGETGPGARPMHPDWVRGLRDQCQAGGVPFFFKSWGEWAPGILGDGDTIRLDDGQLHNLTKAQYEYLTYPEGDAKIHFWRQLKGYADDDYTYSLSVKVGKKRAGHLLDGVEYREYPEVQSSGI